MSRLTDTLMEIGTIGKNEDGSITRIGSSDDYKQAVTLAKKYMDEAGFITDVDTVYNLHGYLPGTDTNAKSIVIGSHLDTVIKGGIFDGCLGVCSGIEVAKRLKEEGIKLRHPLELWGFNLEESSPLGGTFGSRCVVGMVDVNAEGYKERLEKYGMTPEDVLAARRDISKYACYLEYHIEQGDKLFNEGIDIGVVSGIVSIIRYDIIANGISNHAGTTMMANRKDALVGMSKLIVKANALTRELDDTLVATIGKMSVAPGQENVIPNEVVATLEVRHMKPLVTDEYIRLIKEYAAEIPDAEFTFHNTVSKYSTPCDSTIIDNIEKVCTEAGISHVIMPSGAGHDANPMAHEGVPIGMIFVPSKDGLSHCGSEWTEMHHCDMGADILYRTVLALDKQLD